MDGIRYQNCEYHISPGDILMTPMRHGKSIPTGFCTKEKELYYCEGNTCPYLKFIQDELEVKRIMANIFAYYQTITWDELSHGVTVMGKGIKDVTELLTEGF